MENKNNTAFNMENKNLEIERKFLVTNDSYKAQATRYYDIQQGYLCREDGHTVRVRLRWDNAGKGEAFLTIKSKANEHGFSRFEWEKEIDPKDALQLLRLCMPPLIVKRRWIVPAQTEESLDPLEPIESIESLEPLKSIEPLKPEHALCWEIDEFHGHKEGLVLAEIELESESQSFVKPAFIGKEVTGIPEYYNANM